MAAFLTHKELAAHNIETLLSLDENTYPALTAHFTKTKCKTCLYCLLEYLEALEAPGHTSKKGKHYFFVSSRYLIAKHGGSKTTWHNHMILLSHLGLLERIRPGEETVIRKMRYTWHIAQDKNRRVEMWYSIPLYTPELLQEAEQRLVAFKASGIATGHINKASIILADGQPAANKVYTDSRRIPQLQTYIMDEMKKHITRTTEHRGYTTKKEVLQGVRLQLWYMHTSHSKPAFLLPRWEDNRDKIEFVWDSTHNRLLQDTSTVYRRPTKAEKEQYSLKTDRWIITRRTTADE